MKLLQRFLSYFAAVACAIHAQSRVFGPTANPTTQSTTPPAKPVSARVCSNLSRLSPYTQRLVFFFLPPSASRRFQLIHRDCRADAGCKAAGLKGDILAKEVDKQTGIPVKANGCNSFGFSRHGQKSLLDRRPLVRRMPHPVRMLTPTDPAAAHEAEKTGHLKSNDREESSTQGSTINHLNRRP